MNEKKNEIKENSQSPHSTLHKASSSNSGATTTTTTSNEETSQTRSSAAAAAADKYLTRLPWGALKEKPNFNQQLATLLASISNENTTAAAAAAAAAGAANNDELIGGQIERRKPGEYLMKLIVFNFVQIGSKKLEQIINGDKRVGLYFVF